MTRIRLGTRGSALALWQSRFVAARLAAHSPNLTIELVEISSTGDRVVDRPLSDVEGTGFFTAALEEALLDGRVDLAVHSFKDLPVAATPALVVAAIPRRGPAEDVLVARDGMTLATLPSGARVGTCSLRRTAQVLARRADVEIVALRGNVPTRVAKVSGGELDAIVLAKAGLVRLALDAHISEEFAMDVVLPAPAQGALAVQCRVADVALRQLVSALDDPATRAAVTAERTMLHALGGGCSVPVGGFATTGDPGVTLSGAVFDMSGGPALRAQAIDRDPAKAGEMVAHALVALGAAALLAGQDEAPRLASPMEMSR
jgi:hydroxymethylbilane synthase